MAAKKISPFKLWFDYDTGPCGVAECDIPNTNGVTLQLPFEVGARQVFYCDKHFKQLAAKIVQMDKKIGFAPQKSDLTAKGKKLLKRIKAMAKTNHKLANLLERANCPTNKNEGCY